jgi:ArsR family transcriptional regulator, arsenate/arsenite/antimonite-responsive transcriptional repressor
VTATPALLDRDLGHDDAIARCSAVDRSTFFDIFTSVDMSSLPLVELTECCAPLDAPTLSEQEATATAELFKALGDPARVRAINVLATAGEPVCICELIEPLGLAQPTVSHHMKKLLEAGLVEREQRGKWAYFSLKPEALEKLAAVVDLKGVTV